MKYEVHCELDFMVDVAVPVDVLDEATVAAKTAYLSILKKAGWNDNSQEIEPSG